MADELIRIPHPDGDGTWVEFRGMSERQMDIILAYTVLAEQATEGSGLTVSELVQEDEEDDD